MNCKQTYWNLYLSRFDFILKHVPGIKMKKANGLSKRPDWKIETENDNKNKKLIEEEWIYSLTEVVVEGSKVELIIKIKIARSKDKKVIRVIEKMNKAKVKVLRKDK